MRYLCKRRFGSKCNRSVAYSFGSEPVSSVLLIVEFTRFAEWHQTQAEGKAVVMKLDQYSMPNTQYTYSEWQREDPGRFALLVET